MGLKLVGFYVTVLKVVPRQVAFTLFFQATGSASLWN